MKRIIKNPIFTFILGSIIFSSVTVLASQILARDIEYTKDGVTTDVESALNDLYDKANSLGDILYTNTSYDAVEPTTLNLDLSNYQSVVIIGVYNRSTTYSNYVGSVKINVNSSGRLEVVYSQGDSTKRNFIVNSNSIEIKEGISWDNHTNNDSAIPRYIIGIRKNN